MNRALLGAALFAGMVGLAAPASAQQVQPNCDWNCNWGFSSFRDLRDQAVIIDMKEGRVSELR
jgi:hypothetical protein